MNLAALDPQLDDTAATCRVVIETPKASRSKYSWNGSIEALELSGLLPVGMSFPLDFGMVPGTHADDGDPLDVLVIGDEPAVAGASSRSDSWASSKPSRPSEAEPIATIGCWPARLSRSATRTPIISQTSAPPFVDHLGRWFEQFNALKGKGFKVIGTDGPEEAVRSITTHLGAASARN
jgi:inorganic pyrophosphatase